MTSACSFLGYFDDRADDACRRRSTRPAPGQPEAGGASSSASAACNEVYITLPLGSQPRIVELIEQVQGTTASVFFVPDVFGISIIQGRLQDMNGVPVVGLCETPFTGTNRLVKRLSDLVLGTAILLLIAPAAGAHRHRREAQLTRAGHLQAAPQRPGRRGDRGLQVPLDAHPGQRLGGAARPPRTTRASRLSAPSCAARASLDELPQFINVLQGRMSIVGPRPHAVAHNEQYRQLIKAYMVRHKVKPGITGWAQIHGHRGETDTIEKMQARVEYDLEYLRNWSLGLDLQIIARHHQAGVFRPKCILRSPPPGAPSARPPRGGQRWRPGKAGCRRRSLGGLRVAWPCARGVHAESSPWYIAASRSPTRTRTNLLRLARRAGRCRPGCTKSATTTSSSTALLAGLDQSIGRQRLFGNVAVRQQPLRRQLAFQQHQGYNASLRAALGRPSRSVSGNAVVPAPNRALCRALPPTCVTAERPEFNLESTELGSTAAPSSSSASALTEWPGRGAWRPAATGACTDSTGRPALAAQFYARTRSRVPN